MLSTAQQADRYVVIGNPIAHSRSPDIHRMFAAQTGQHIHYAHCLSPLDGFAATLVRLRAEGVKGCNVTVPFKQEAAEQATHIDTHVALAQAANTLVLHTDGSIQAINTDGPGLVRDITATGAGTITDQHILLLGAGGAAAGVLGPLLAQHPASITLANRSVDKAQALVHTHARLAQTHGVALHALALDAIDTATQAGTLAPIGLLINATASSLQGGQLPIARMGTLLADGALVYDMMYGQQAQPFLLWAQQQGRNAGKTIHLRDGLGMLVEQAAASFALWRGIYPDTAPVLQALRQQIALENP